MQKSSLFEAIIEASRKHGATRLIASDVSGGNVTYRQLFLRAFLLAPYLARHTGSQRYAAIMLPNTLAAVVSFFGLQALGKIPCMINFASGAENIMHACRIAGTRTVFTSRAFIEQAKLTEVAQAISAELELVYLEDIRAQISLTDKLKAAFKSFFPAWFYKATPKENDPAVVLYTSGSEGVPKGVVLSHKNILSNIAQVVHHITFTSDDRMFNPLPVFHSFGLSVGMILPLVLGIPLYLYPSPLHYKQIPPLVRKLGSTIFLGTDTFYRGYAKYAEPEDFKTLRLTVAGGERLKESTRQDYQNRLNVTILQGYGVTETSPVISFNTQDFHKPDTAGKAFIGTECKIEPVEGLERGGRLLVSGANVMLGYLRADSPGQITPAGPWYDTGDIVEIDAEGYIHILGRAKRFAKIGGEMVSLVAVEELAFKVDSDAAHAAVAVPDERKGEQVILFTEAMGLSKDQLLTIAQSGHIPELYLPKKVEYIEALPRLGNGKIDYPALSSLAMALSSKP